jgi:hypothetical protein
MHRRRIERVVVLLLFTACGGSPDADAEGDGGEASSADAAADSEASDAGEGDDAADDDAADDGGSDGAGTTGDVGGGAPVVTYDVAQESSEGTDSCITWQTAFLMDDGRIVSFGTGNHAPEQTNAVRCIDPVGMPGVVQSYDLFPWTQADAPPDAATGSNLYVSNYDNHPSMYLPGDDAVLWAGHGIFDVPTNAWTHGDRPPLSLQWDDYVDTSASPASATVYNPGHAWCDELGLGVWHGGSGGGYGVEDPDMVLIEPNEGDPDMPWRLSLHAIAGSPDFHNARNTAACAGRRLFMGGPIEGGGTGMVEIDVETRTLVAERAALPDVGDYYAQMVHDSLRNRLVLLGVGVYVYEIGVDAWVDVTPADWPGYEAVNGVYHAELDAIFFRGTVVDAPGDFATCFSWHRMDFE